MNLQQESNGKGNSTPSHSGGEGSSISRLEDIALPTIKRRRVEPQVSLFATFTHHIIGHHSYWSHHDVAKLFNNTLMCVYLQYPLLTPP